MLTFQGMRDRTRYMMEAIRRAAIDETFEKWQKALRNYYTTGYDNGETTALYKELVKLGANPDVLLDTDLEIHAEVFGIR